MVEGIPEPQGSDILIPQRSHGNVDESYWKAKEELLKNRRKGFCLICGAELPKFRRKYCSYGCFQNWFKKFKPPFLWNDFREKALKRDGHKCVKCGDTYGLVVDHIVAIALGGEEFDLNNLQTLCHDCNYSKTLGDMKKIAELRKRIRDGKSPNKQISPEDMKARWLAWEKRAGI